MKKLLLPILLIICLFSACGAQTVDPGMDKVAQAVGSAISDSNMVVLDSDYVSNMIKLDSSGYAEYVAKRVNVGTSIDEYGIFKGKDSAQAAELKTAVQAYLQFRLDSWMSEYLPEEFPKLQSAEVWTDGDYVIYVILGDESKAAARSAFSDAFQA